MVLTDDNFASIVNAVEEGRGIFENIQKFIHYLLTCNAGEVLQMLAAAVMGWQSPLRAIQLLWINLVTDGLPALALAMEPAERDIMLRPPRPPREPVITWSRGALILFEGILLAIAAGIGFSIVFRHHDGSEDQLQRAQTVAFCIMAFEQLLFSIACRSKQHTLPQLGLWTNPYLLGAILISALLQLGVVLLPFAREVFEVSLLSTWEWWLVAGLSFVPVTIIELGKLLFAGRAGRASS
jgi:Ca2+-transporting ATPase